MLDEYLEQTLNSLDGDVYAHGIKLSHRDWLDMGYEKWNDSDISLKRKAFLASQKTGWSKESLTQLMV